MAFPRICPLCGPKLSICCMIMSAWGIIFLGILGLFFYFQSAMLYEDLSLPKYKENEVTEKFSSVARNCWIATGAYAVTLIVAFWQNKWHSRLAMS